jgi:hypothetical protein
MGIASLKLNMVESLESHGKASYILGVDSNAKTVKGHEVGYLTGIVYLEPSDGSGVNLCGFSSKGCRAVCLKESGRLRMESVSAGKNDTITGRMKRTFQLLTDKTGFLNQLRKEIESMLRKADKLSLVPAIRLNGLSDIKWESIIDSFPSVQFYDYTKDYNYYLKFQYKQLPNNYHLTYSLSEDECPIELFESSQDHNKDLSLAIPFFPESYYRILKDGELFVNPWLSVPVVDGDKNDLRFIDPKNCIVALKAKGIALKVDSYGFIRNYTTSGMII